MKDELETEVNKKIEEMHQDDIVEDDDYDDDTYLKQDTPLNKSYDIMKEDTIKTDKINEIMEQEDKIRFQEKFTVRQDEYSQKELDNLDIIEDIDKSREMKNNLIHSDRFLEEIIDDEVQKPDFEKALQQNEKHRDDSEVEEDYEF